jgi:cytoskeletal protein CcmA (bactofilin family)
MANARGSAAKRTEDGRGTIGPSTRVRGRISGDGHLNVDGHVEGDIAIRGDLMVGEGASLSSNVEAQSVTVSGTVEGDLSARGQVRISAGARVRGNVRGEHVAIEEGAQFAGRLDLEFDLPQELMTVSGASSSRKRS